MFSVRVLTADDSGLKDRLDELLWEVLWEPLGLPRQIRRQFQLPGPSMEFVAVVNGAIAGGVVFNRLNAAEAELRHIAVQPCFQASGVGRELVQTGLRFFRQEGCQMVSTIARSTSAGFFARIGFEPVPEPVADHPLFLKHGIRFQKMMFQIKRGEQCPGS